VFHAHLHDTAEISPILALTSPTPECGKTTALNLIGALVPKALASSNITAAAVFRGIEKWRPTLLVDEADTFLKNNDDLRGVINSGHYRRAAFVIRVTGENLEPTRFTTWAPKVIALIGKLPPTLASRSIHIEMRRMAPGETAEPVRLERLDFTTVVASVARWAQDHDLSLRDAEPDMPGSLLGRRADNWRHLFAIADLAGGIWPARARAAAETLTAKGSEQTTGILLLEDINLIFAAEGKDRISSAALVEKLVDIETRPWGEWSRGKPITVRQLARLLAPFGVGPAKIRTGTTTLQGYRLESFDDAFARYPLKEPEHRHNPQKSAENRPIRSGTHIDPVPDENPRKPAENRQCSGVLDETRVAGDEQGIGPWRERV
jgi:putative DNA primase/helicase